MKKMAKLWQISVGAEHPQNFPQGAQAPKHPRSWALSSTVPYMNTDKFQWSSKLTV